MSEVKVNKISSRSGTTVTIGDSGDTTNIVGTLQNNGAALTGDITSVVAGTNLSGGGTSGDVTLNLADASTSVKGASSFSSDNFSASSGAITIKDLGIATAELQDNAVTLAKMASGTDGNIISYDASGNPVAVATGNAGQILTSAGAGAPPTFATAASTNPYTAQSLGQSGYIKLVGGLIIQWGAFGTFGGTVSTGTVSFPITFPTAIDGIATSLWNSNSSTLSSLVLNSTISTSQFTWYQPDTSQSSRVGSYIVTGR